MEKIDNQGIALSHYGDFENAYQWFLLKGKKIKGKILERRKGKFSYDAIRKSIKKETCEGYR